MCDATYTYPSGIKVQCENIDHIFEEFDTSRNMGYCSICNTWHEPILHKRHKTQWQGKEGWYTTTWDDWQSDNPINTIVDEQIDLTATTVINSSD